MIDVFDFLLDGLPLLCKQTNLLTLGKSLRNDPHASSNKSGLSRLRLEQCRLKAFSLSADNFSRRPILPSAKLKSLPASCGTSFPARRKTKYLRERRSISGQFESRRVSKTPVSFKSSPLPSPQQGNRQLKASTQTNLPAQKSVKNLFVLTDHPLCQNRCQLIYRASNDNTLSTRVA